MSIKIINLKHPILSSNRPYNVTGATVSEVKAKAIEEASKKYYKSYVNNK